MTAVVDSGPLIALAKVDRLDLYARLFGQVIVPEAVRHELLASHRPETAKIEQALATFVHVRSAPQPLPAIITATRTLNTGEQEAIALAQALGVLLVIDDRHARRLAERLALPMTGVGGVLLRAKRAGMVARIRPLLEELHRNDYWLAPGLIERLVHLAGE